MERITEMASTYRHLDKMSVNELLVNMNREDRTVPDAVEKAIPQIEKLVQAIVQKMQNGGRLFYIGAGTSGRLGVLDASECPPTYGVPKDLIIGIIAGGDTALRNSVEAAEDNHLQAWHDLKVFDIDAADIVVGIAASGTTPYVIEGLKKCRSEGVATACITCNPQSLLAEVSDFPVEIVTGPEFVTGSTRMKAGTAQKLALNMISTAVMIQMGRVLDNIMVDMQLSNHKLIDRGIKMIMKQLNVSYSEANNLLQKHGNVRNVLNNHAQSSGVNA
ncbi:MAG: N-acetylmuramic acid 6-phosphate etherase [Saprospiraceae bacterium]|nr:N-acetylmuramic acid 6-phosphate etherase [Saprospiraceae bacterium]